MGNDSSTRTSLVVSTAPNKKKKEPRALAPTSGEYRRPSLVHAPVFLHSSFRTSSTWLWIKFRENEKAVAYCEYFHERLAHITHRNFDSDGPRAWGAYSSHHPDTDPYFLEFFPLIKPSGGLEGYDSSMALERFIPMSGIEMDLSMQEISYVRQLIELAQRRGGVPVLSCTRTLGRIAGLKRAFGGHHIFLHRNLLQQWNSYSHQQRDGNPYFVRTLLTYLQTCGHDPFVRILAGYAKGRLEPEALPSSNTFDSESWLPRLNSDDLFILFVAFHVYLSMIAVKYADTVIDVTSLARRGVRYRQNLEKEIYKKTGLAVNLSDVMEMIEYPLAPIKDFGTVKLKIEAFFGLAVSLSDVNNEQITFGREMLDALWNESSQFSFYTRSLSQLFERQALELERAEQAKRQVSLEQSDLAEQAKSLSAERDQLQQKIPELVGIRDRLTSEMLDLQSRLDAAAASDRELRKLAEDLIDERDRLAQQLSTSEKLEKELQAERDKLRQKIPELVETRDRLTSEMLDLQSRLDAAAASDRELRQQLEELIGERDRLAQQVSTSENLEKEIQAERDQLQQRITELVGGRDRLTSDKLELQSRLEASAASERELSQEVDSLNAELARTMAESEELERALTAERDQLREQIAEFIEDLRRQTSENLNLQGRLDETTDNNEALANLAKSLAAERELLALDHAALLSTNEQRANDSYELKRSLDELTLSHAELSQRIDAISVEKAELASQAASLLAEREQLYKRVDSIANERNKLLNEKVALHRRLDGLSRGSD